MEDGGNNAQEARLSIRVGNAKIDLRGTEQVVTAEILKLRADEQWSSAIKKVRDRREMAFEAAREAARTSGMPERGSAFKSLVDTCQLKKRCTPCEAVDHQFYKLYHQQENALSHHHILSCIAHA